MDSLHALPKAQEQLGYIGRTKVFELIKRGELETVKIGRRRLVPQSSIDRYITRLKADSE